MTKLNPYPMLKQLESQPVYQIYSLYQTYNDIKTIFDPATSAQVRISTAASLACDQVVKLPIASEMASKTCESVSSFLYDQAIKYNNTHGALTQSELKIWNDIVTNKSDTSQITPIQWDKLSQFSENLKQSPNFTQAVKKSELNYQNNKASIDIELLNKNKEYQKALEEQQQKQTEEALLINNSPEQTNSFFDKVGKAVISIESVGQFASLVATVIEKLNQKLIFFLTTIFYHISTYFAFKHSIKL